MQKFVKKKVKKQLYFNRVIKNKRADLIYDENGPAPMKSKDVFSGLEYEVDMLLDLDYKEQLNKMGG